MDFKQVRVIPYDVTKRGILRTVNMSATPSTTSKKCLQLTSAQAVTGIHATVMASPTVDTERSNVGISGYSGPN